MDNSFLGIPTILIPIGILLSDTFLVKLLIFPWLDILMRTIYIEI